LAQAESVQNSFRGIRSHVSNHTVSLAA